MKTFKKHIEEMGVPANNIAGTGATSIAKYDPVMKLAMYRRKPKKHKNRSGL